MSMDINDILEEISSLSDSQYQEGGIYYKYSYFHRCAHVEMSSESLEQYKASGTRFLDDSEVRNISLFIESAVHEPFSSNVCSTSQRLASNLIANLKKHFEVGFVKVSSYDVGDYGIDLTIETIEGNNGYRWVLSWSID